MEIAKNGIWSKNFVKLIYFISPVTTVVGGGGVCLYKSPKNSVKSFLMGFGWKSIKFSVLSSLITPAPPPPEASNFDEGLGGGIKVDNDLKKNRETELFIFDIRD